MRYLSLFVLLLLLTSSVHADGAGKEWEKLTEETLELLHIGKYDSAIIVAQKALEIAEINVGPDHPDVATNLEILASLYRATDRIRAIER